MMNGVRFGAVKPYPDRTEANALLEARRKNGTQVLDVPRWLLEEPLSEWDTTSFRPGRYFGQDGVVLSGKHAEKADSLVKKLGKLNRVHSDLARLNRIHGNPGEATKVGYEELLSPDRNNVVRTAIMEQLQAEAADVVGKIKDIIAGKKPQKSAGY